MNLTTLTAIASRFAQDPQQSRYAGLYTQALNLANQQFALDSKCTFKDSPTYTIVAGQAAYSLPSDFMWEKMVFFNGCPLTPITRRELGRLFPVYRWDTNTGTPCNYVVDPEQAKKELLLYPIPVDNDSGKDLVITYFALPPDMVNGGDIPLNSSDLLAQFHIGLSAWAAWYLLQTEQVTAEISAKKKDLISIYNDAVSQCVDTFKNTASAIGQRRGSRTY